MHPAAAASSAICAMASPDARRLPFLERDTSASARSHNLEKIVSSPQPAKARLKAQSIDWRPLSPSSRAQGLERMADIAA
jgi:hypothetical protein